MEACGECGFDPAHWNPADAASTLRIVHVWFEWLAEGAPADIAGDLQPYRETIAAVRRDPATYDEALGEVHLAWHALARAGRVRHRGTASQRGHVIQVNASRGGVPKSSVSGPAAIGWAGLEIDCQDDRDNHGRPWQAICLWSADVIDRLADEGHPIAAGRAGENLTLGGLDWAAVTPGQRLQVGTARLETTPYSTPCSKNAPWFLAGEFRRMSHDLHPGWSRIYARVLKPGTVSAGDTVTVLP
ncbi:MAG TPA: MOSC domain-containing protein [Mycobacteriales bacterium]|nr:MOSC domain-containing protein [Mycobacteriales bacterium]